MDDDTNDNVNIADQLLDIITDNYSIIMDQDRSPWLIIRKDKLVQFVRLPSDEAKSWLRREYYIETKKTIASDPINRVLDTLLMFAHEPDIPIWPVLRRVDQTDEKLYYGLTDYQMIKVSKDKISLVKVTEKNIRFTQAVPQVEPNFQSPAEQLQPLLGKLFRLSSDNLLLLSAWLCGCFLMDISHPILVLHGSHGSSKTTTLRTLNKIVDPVLSDVFTLPHDKQGLIAALSNRYFLAFDNLQTLPQWMSDLFCNVVTGGSAPMRQLYTTNTLVSANLKGCVCLNGLDLVVTRKDLLDRSIVIGLQRIPDDEWITEKEYTALVKSLLPDILGSIFNILQSVLVLRDEITVRPRVRMADFCVYGYLICEAQNKGSGEAFLSIYQENLKNTGQKYRPDILVQGISHLLENRKVWEGKSQEFYDLMRKDIEDRKGFLADFPSNSANLTRQLNNMRTELLTQNIHFKKTKDSDGIRGIKLWCENPENGGNGGNGDTEFLGGGDSVEQADL